MIFLYPYYKLNVPKHNITAFSHFFGIKIFFVVNIEKYSFPQCEYNHYNSQFELNFILHGLLGKNIMNKNWDIIHFSNR